MNLESLLRVDGIFIHRARVDKERIKYGIFGEGFQISTNQMRENRLSRF